MDSTPNNSLQSEIDKFDAMRHLWWDPRGTMGTLHTINPLRLAFILDALGGRPGKILDVGCGGGILAEALAKAGREVTGIDLSTQAIDVARSHAREAGLAINYHVRSAEAVAAAEPGSYACVTCMEMLEHVPDPAGVVRACAAALRPGGVAVFSSVDRTPWAWFLVIFGGELVMRFLPRGSHQYKMLVKPSELRAYAEAAGLRFVGQASLSYNPLKGNFSVRQGVAEVNYMMAFERVG